MKARIKSSGAVGEIKGFYNTPTGKMVIFENGLECDVNRVDILEEPYSAVQSLNWDAFRADAAKFAMAAIISNWGHGFAGHSDTIPAMAIEFADSLIEQLKK